MSIVVCDICGKTHRGEFETCSFCMNKKILQFEEAMKPKTCDVCKWEQETKIIKTNIGDRIDICKLCLRYKNLQDYYEPKDNA